MQRMHRREQIRIDLASALYCRESLRVRAVVWKMLSNSHVLLRCMPGDFDRKESCLGKFEFVPGQCGGDETHEYSAHG